MNDTEPMAESAADTDPGWPPKDAPTLPGGTVEEATEEEARPLGYKEQVSDSDVADLLGRLAPARRPPAVGDTRETNGHDAAKANVSLRVPPKATQLKAITDPIIIDITQPGPPPDFRRYDSTVPRARPQSSPNSVKIIVGLAGGVLLMTIALLVVRPWGTNAAPAVASAAPSVSTPSVAPSVASSGAPSVAVAVPASVPVAVSASPPTAPSAIAPAVTAPEVVPTTTSRRPVPRPSAAPSASPRLPTDIKPTLE